jgi:hypothetical protein
MPSLSLQADLKGKLSDSSFNLTIENHEYGLSPAMYNCFPVLSEWYTVLSTTRDRNGTEYISSMEGKKHPFFGELHSMVMLLTHNPFVWFVIYFISLK